MAYPISFEEKDRVEEFLERYSDSEEHLCLNCCAEYRADIAQCPECEEELHTIEGAKAAWQERLDGMRQALAEAADKASCDCDDDCDSDGEADDAPLSAEEKKKIAAFVEGTDDEAEGLACIACLIVCEPGFTSCTVCGNGLLQIVEAKVALSHLLQTDAAGEAPAAIAFVPAEASEMLGADVAVKGAALEESEAGATDEALAQQIASERMSVERREALLNFIAQYGDVGIDADVCVECLEEFRVGIGECPQCGAPLLPGEDAIKKLKALL